MTEICTSASVARKALKTALAGCLCLLMLLALSIAAEGQKKPEQFSATGFGQAGMFAGKTVSMNIYITDYSDNQEVEDLAATLRTKGSDPLLKAIQKMKAKARVVPTGYTGWNVAVVRQRPTKNGRRIVMFGDRPIGFYEARNAPRSKGYEFGMLVLDVNEKGEGSGLLYGACKIKFTKDDQVDIEHFSQQPIRLTTVKLWK